MLDDLGSWFAGTALSGSLLLAVPVALVAGLVSFFSPCVVPLLPGYLSYATGLSGADLESARRGRMVLGSTLFVLLLPIPALMLGLSLMTVGWRAQGTERVVAMIVGFAFAIAYPRHIVLVAAVVLGATVMLEALQLLSPSRHGRLVDVAAKLIGAGAGIGTGWLLAKAWRKRSNR